VCQQHNTRALLVLIHVIVFIVSGELLGGRIRVSRVIAIGSCVRSSGSIVVTKYPIQIKKFSPTTNIPPLLGNISIAVPGFEGAPTVWSDRSIALGRQFLFQLSDVFGVGTVHEGAGDGVGGSSSQVESWRSAAIVEDDVHFCRTRKADNLYVRDSDPSSLLFPKGVLSKFQLTRGGICSTLSGVRSLLVGAIHQNRKERVDREKYDASGFHVWLGLVPPILFCFASNLAMVLGWLTLRLWCRCWRDWYLGMLGLFAGFPLSVWSGIILMNRIGF
jgi:hypothetical protein